MTSHKRFPFIRCLLPAVVLLVSSSSPTTAFSSIVGRTVVRPTNGYQIKYKHAPTFVTHGSSLSSSPSVSTLFMASDDDGPGPLIQVGILLIMILFVGTGLLPLMDGGGGRDLSIADSVVTQQDATSGRLGRTMESNQDRLSRATIQEKLSGIPVFYLVDSNGSMGTNVYLSFNDAKIMADETPGTTIKATSLDQVMYPLILKRGRMRMASPPAEIERAESELASSTTDQPTSGSPKSYRLVPSQAAVNQAKEFNMKLVENDIPLFVADRLAFASPRGPQLPLFTDKSDCEFSYQRLRNGKSSLPEQPIIRIVSLLDELDSMERGTKPGVGQLAFYATADDVAKAAELLQ